MLPDGALKLLENPPPVAHAQPPWQAALLGPLAGVPVPGEHSAVQAVEALLVPRGLGEAPYGLAAEQLRYLEVRHAQGAQAPVVVRLGHVVGVDVAGEV